MYVPVEMCYVSVDRGRDSCRIHGCWAYSLCLKFDRFLNYMGLIQFILIVWRIAAVCSIAMTDFKSILNWSYKKMLLEFRGHYSNDWDTVNQQKFTVKIFRLICFTNLSPGSLFRLWPQRKKLVYARVDRKWVLSSAGETWSHCFFALVLLYCWSGVWN